MNNNIIAAGENVIKLYDTNGFFPLMFSNFIHFFSKGMDLSSYSIESSNGNIVDIDVNLNFIYSCMKILKTFKKFIKITLIFRQ